MGHQKPLRKQPHHTFSSLGSAGPIGSAIDGTFRRTYESSPLLHRVPTKEGLNQSCVCETSWIQVYSWWTSPTIQPATLKQRGRNSSIVVRMPPVLDPNARLPNAESKRKHSTEAANGISTSDVSQLQHRRLWLAEGAEVCSPQPFGDTSSCHLIPAAAVIVLRRHWRCCTRPMLEEQRRGTNVETTQTVIV